MGWTLKTIDKRVGKVFEEFVAQQLDNLQSHDIYIWGASVRGALLGICLEKKGITNFCYIDNDKDKWGKFLSDYSIYKPDYEMLKSNSALVLIPVEHSQDICNQLQNNDISNYLTITSNEEQLLYDEYKRKCNDYLLFFGDGIFHNVAIGEDNAQSLSEIIETKCGKDNAKVLAINCVGMELIYHMLNKTLLRGDKVKKVFLFVGYETLTDFHYKLPRTQHLQIIRNLAKEGKDQVVWEYYDKALEYSKDYMFELDHSPKRTGSDKDEFNIQKEYLLQSLYYKLNPDNEEMQFLNKIISLCKANQLPLVVVQVPNNFEVNEKMYKDINHVVEMNNGVISRIVGDNGFEYVDLSCLLTEEYFISGVTTADVISISGKEKIYDAILK